MSLENAIKSIVREHHFSPAEIDALFFDDTDYHGMMFWYEDVKAVNAELKKKT